MISTMSNMQVSGITDHVIIMPKVSMALSFATSNFPVKNLNDAYKSGDKFCIRSIPSVKSHLQNELASRAALSQNNAVGIIGGVSVLSTLIFLEKLVLWSSRNGQNGVPFIVCSDPMLRKEAYTSSIALTKKNLRGKRVFLEEGGAKCIVMPCHVSHAFYGEISLGCKLPFLHVAQCVVRELKEAKFRPLEAGCGVKIGVIANEATLMAGFYQEELQNQGFEVALPDKATMEHIVKPAIKCLKQKDIEGARNLLRITIQGLLVRAVNTVILASDELQCLLPHDDPLVKYCVDPMDSLARSAVRWANSAKVTLETSR